MSKVNPVNFNAIAVNNKIGEAVKKGASSNVLFNSKNTLPKQHYFSSQINTRLPVSYSQIAEMPIAGVENKARIYKLSNGQKIVLLKKEGPLVVQTFFKTGGLNEQDNMRGISHFIEHNLFNGSERLKPREYDQRLAKIGAYTNAFTSNNVTSYYIQSALGREYLEELIKLNAEQVQFPTFPIAQMEKEKEIVCSEINMIDDNTENSAICNMIKELFQINSTSTDLVAGNIDNISSLTRDDLIKYFNTYYSPNNTTTVIVGDIDPDETIKLVSKYYTKQNPQQPLKKNHEILKPIDSPRRADYINDKAVGTSISLGFAGPANNNIEDRLAVSMALNLLNGSSNSKLNSALDKHCASGSFEFDELGNQDSDNTYIAFNTTVPEEISEQILSTIYSEISNFLKNPPTQEEFEIEKRKMIDKFQDMNERAQGLSLFIGKYILSGNNEFISEYPAKIKQLSLEDVISAASKYMDLNKAAVCFVHPKSATEESIKENYRKNAKSQNISFKGQSDLHKTMFDNVREYILPNNMSVSVNPVYNGDKCIFITKYTHPIFKDITAGEMAVLNYLINSGSMYTDEKDFSNKLDRRDINLTFEITPTAFTYYVKCPQTEMQTSFNFLNEVMLNPRFTQKTLDNAIKKTKNIINTTPQSPNAKLIKAMFPDQKLGQTNEEILADLNNITLERIKELYSRIFQNTCASSTITMPMNQYSMLENIYTNNLLRTVPPNRPYIVELDDTFSPNAAPIILSSEEKTAQANVTQAYKFQTTRNIDDDAKIMCLNTLLGGGMNSRLFKDLRETQKLAYNVGSLYENNGNTGFITLNISTTTNNPNDPKSSPANITSALESFQKHIDILKTTKVDKDELKQAKAILKNNLLEMTETKYDKTLLLSESKNNFYGREYIKLLLDAIDRVTANDIRSCAKYVFAQHPITSVVASKNTLDSLKLK